VASRGLRACTWSFTPAVIFAICLTPQVDGQDHADLDCLAQSDRVRDQNAWANTLRIQLII
jgi:hypothetical protein